jgi:intracellular multiplication protein IcmK
MKMFNYISGLRFGVLMVLSCFVLSESAYSQVDFGFESFGGDGPSAPSTERRAPAPTQTRRGAPAQPQFANPGFDLPVDDSTPVINDPFELPAVNASSFSEPLDLEKEIREEAFKAAITGLLPMNTDEIRKLLKRYDETQQAVEVPVYPYPKAAVEMVTVQLDPGAPPPVISVAVGHVTTLNIVDITGEPWPIFDVSWAGNFEIIEPGEGSHVVRITPMSEFAYGNISFGLLTLKTPVTFTIKTSRDKVHYRLDARIPEYGPFAEEPLIEGNSLDIAVDNEVLGKVLDGVVPISAEKLEVIGVDGRTTAYRYLQKTYVRTPLTLLSPGWSSSVSSADGMKVYELMNAPVILLSDRGDMVRAKIREAGLVDSDE